jgi:hypothetical protein
VNAIVTEITKTDSANATQIDLRKIRSEREIVNAPGIRIEAIRNGIAAIVLVITRRTESNTRRSTSTINPVRGIAAVIDQWIIAKD